MASFTCPHCSQAFENAEDAGKSVRCPHCQGEFVPEDGAVASGRPLPRPTQADTSVTGKAPASKKSADDDDERMSPERRDIARKPSSAAGPILIIGAVVVVTLCICAAPALLFIGVFPFFAVREQRGQAAVMEVEAQAMPPMEVAEVAVAVRGLAKGKADAEAEIARNKLLLKEYPPSPAPPWQGDYVKLLQERCKCDYQVIQGKLAKAQEDEIKGWNEAMNAELVRRHGANIIANLQDEAQKQLHKK